MARNPLVSFLFDTDAISELFKPKPSTQYLSWLKTVPREEQFTSAVVVGELFAGAFRSRARERHLENIRRRVLPLVTVLPYDLPVAEQYGALRAELAAAGQSLADADLQIASTALIHGLTLVTWNLKHFARIDGLEISRALSTSRHPVG